MAGKSEMVPENGTPTLEVGRMVVSADRMALTIELQQLWKSYDGKPALQGLFFEARPGEIVGLIGPNGAGKTTTLKILVGLLRPDYGLVRVKGNDVLADPISYKADVGYMPEAPTLPEYLTPNEFLGYVGRIRNLPRDRIADRTRELLAILDLAPKADESIDRDADPHPLRLQVAILLRTRIPRTLRAPGLPRTDPHLPAVGIRIRVRPRDDGEGGGYAERDRSPRRPARGAPVGRAPVLPRRGRHSARIRVRLLPDRGHSPAAVPGRRPPLPADQFARRRRARRGRCGGRDDRRDGATRLRGRSALRPARGVRVLRLDDGSSPRHPPGPIPKGPGPARHDRDSDPVPAPIRGARQSGLPDPVRGPPDSGNGVRGAGPRGPPGGNVACRRCPPRNRVGRRYRPRVVRAQRYLHRPRTPAHDVRGLRPSRHGFPHGDAAALDRAPRRGHDPRPIPAGAGRGHEPHDATPSRANLAGRELRVHRYPCHRRDPLLWLWGWGRERHRGRSRHTDRDPVDGNPRA